MKRLTCFWLGRTMKSDGAWWVGTRHTLARSGSAKASKIGFLRVRVPRKCYLSYFSFFPVVLKSPHGSRSQVEPEEPEYCQRL